MGWGSRGNDPERVSQVCSFPHAAWGQNLGSLCLEWSLPFLKLGKLSPHPDNRKDTHPRAQDPPAAEVPALSPAGGRTTRASPAQAAGAGGADPGTAADRGGAGVQAERIRAKPKTKAALGGPRRAPCQGTRCPRDPSPHRRLLEWLSSTPRFPRGAAPGLVTELVQTARIWCK